MTAVPLARVRRRAALAAAVSAPRTPGQGLHRFARGSSRSIRTWWARPRSPRTTRRA